MALLDSEIARIKAELGYNVLSNGAAPWVDTVAIFEQVIQPNLSGGATTTSTTSVESAAVPEPVSITLSSATGFSAGARIVIDVDDRQEIATVRSMSGSAVTVLIQKAHSGTYPVTVEGPETVVREILTRIREVKEKLISTHGHGALKSVDEVSFHESKGDTAFDILGASLRWYREQLAAVLGISSRWSTASAASGKLSVY